jgi:hypothetical protein
MTLVFLVAAFALMVPAYLWALHLQDEREKQEPRNPQVREALTKVMAKGKQTEPIQTYAGDPRRHTQFHVVQRYQKKASGE